MQRSLMTVGLFVFVAGSAQAGYCPSGDGDDTCNENMQEVTVHAAIRDDGGGGGGDWSPPWTTFSYDFANPDSANPNDDFMEAPGSGGGGETTPREAEPEVYRNGLCDGDEPQFLGPTVQHSCMQGQVNAPNQGVFDRIFALLYGASGPSLPVGQIGYVIDAMQLYSSIETAFTYPEPTYLLRQWQSQEYACPGGKRGTAYYTSGANYFSESEYVGVSCNFSLLPPIDSALEQKYHDAYLIRKLREANVVLF